MSSGSRSDRGTLPSNRSNDSRPSRPSNTSHPSRRTNRTRHSASVNVSDSTASASVVGKSWARFVPFIGYHHVLMILLSIGIVLSSLILAGCTASGLRNVYLLSLAYNNEITRFSSNVSAALASVIGNASHTLELRVGFIGACVKLTSGWTCSPDFSTVASKVSQATITADLNTTESYDPLGLINIGKRFRDEVVFDGLMFVMVGSSLLAVCVFYTFPGWHNDEEMPEAHEQLSNSERGSRGDQTSHKLFPKGQLSRVILGFTLVAAVLALLSVFWQHLGSAGAATMVEVSTDGTIEAHLGSIAMGLGWTAAALNVVVFILTLIMILSIRVLSRISD